MDILSVDAICDTNQWSQNTDEISLECKLRITKTVMWHSIILRQSSPRSHNPI